jgi:hypothetical protein
VLRKVNTKGINNPVNKWANELNSFQKKPYKWPLHTQRNALAMKEMQIKPH